MAGTVAQNCSYQTSGQSKNWRSGVAALHTVQFRTNFKDSICGKRCRKTRGCNLKLVFQCWFWINSSFATIPSFMCLLDPAASLLDPISSWMYWIQPSQHPSTWVFYLLCHNGVWDGERFAARGTLMADFRQTTVWEVGRHEIRFSNQNHRVSMVELWASWRQLFWCQSYGILLTGFEYRLCQSFFWKRAFFSRCT